MTMIRTVLTAASLLICGRPALAVAQRTGTFSDDTLAAIATRGGVRATRDLAIAKSNRALMFDPSARSSLRASGWTIVIAHEENNEARIQANLCDLFSGLCGNKNSWDLTLAGPVDTSSKFNELADLDGLVGQARLESGYSVNVGAETGLTAEIRGTYAKFRSEYHTTTSLAPATFDENATALNVGIGYKFQLDPAANRRALSFLTKLSYRREDSFKAADSRHLCTPSSVGPSGTLECADFVVGEPSPDNGNALSVEQWMSIAGVAGIRLKFSHDFTKDVSGWELPVYVIPDGKGGIGGGVRVGYRTDDKKPRFSVFVSALKF